MKWCQQAQEKKIENHRVKKIRPITTFQRQPLAEATDAGSEASALKLTQGNRCNAANQPTANILRQENLIKTAIQDVEQQSGYEKAATHTENENTDIIQNSVAAKGGLKETQESSMC